MEFNINVSLFKKDELCSIDDKMISHKEIYLSKEKALKCINEINKILEKYS